MDQNIKKLTESGLSEKEARVYHAGLLLGPTTVLKLARGADLKRATVYSVIDSLVAQGLMRVDEMGLKKVFVAENPQNLERVIAKKMESVHSVIPMLETLFKKSGKDRNITTYEGLAALENISRRLMQESRSGDFRYFIGGDVGWESVDPKLQQTYFKWRERISLDAKLIFQDSKRAQQHQDLAKMLRQEVKVLPKQMELKVDIVITPKTLVLAKLSAPMSAVVIEDEDIINTYKELFLFMWDSIQASHQK